MKLTQSSLAVRRTALTHQPSGWRRLLAWADSLALEMAARPLRSLGVVLAIDLTLAGCFAAIGPALFDDRAAFFRELAPATLVSFFQLLLIATAAYAIHTRDAHGLAWHRSFWGLSAAVFLVFAFDEITQSAIFIGDLLEDGFGMSPTGGFHDIEAVLLTLLFATAALVLLPRATVLLRHRVALGLFAVATVLGAASQSLDSFAPATDWEFVAEETLKLGAGAFFVGGFLKALQDVSRRDSSVRRERREGPRAA